MSSDFHTHFPASDLCRGDLLARLEPLWLIGGCSFSGQCQELSWEQKYAQYIFTYRELKFESAEKAVQLTAQWDGVMLEYDCAEGDRSFFFWNNERGGGQTFGFDDAPGHFTRIIEDESRWEAYEEFVLDVAAMLNTTFALTMKGQKYSTLTEDNLLALVENLPEDPHQVKPSLIVVQRALAISPKAHERLAMHYRLLDRGGFLVYRENNFGIGPE